MDHVPSCVFVTAMLIQKENIFQLTPVLQNTMQKESTTTVNKDTRCKMQDASNRQFDTM